MSDHTISAKRRATLKKLGASGVSLTLLSAPVMAGSGQNDGAEQLEGVAYDLRTHETISDAEATVARSAAGVNGNLRIGNATYPVDIGNEESIPSPNTPQEHRRFKKNLGGEHAPNGVKSRLFVLNQPECLAGFVREFDPNRPMNFDSVGFCLMNDYRSARNTIGGEN